MSQEDEDKGYKLLEEVISEIHHVLQVLFWGAQAWIIFPPLFEDSGDPLTCFDQKTVSEGDVCFTQAKALDPVFFTLSLLLHHNNGQCLQ